MWQKKFSNQRFYEMQEGEKFASKLKEIRIPKWIEPTTWIEPMTMLTTDSTSSIPFRTYRIDSRLINSYYGRTAELLDDNPIVWEEAVNWIYGYDANSFKKENKNKGPMRVIRD